MKYDTKKWLESVIDLKGTGKFMMKELPKELRISGNLKPLANRGILIPVGEKFVGGSRYYAKEWRISPDYIKNRQSERAGKTPKHNKAVSFPMFDIVEDDKRFGLINMVCFVHNGNSPHVSIASRLQSTRGNVGVSTILKNAIVPDDEVTT